jgi:hypothetical protein
MFLAAAAVEVAAAAVAGVEWAVSALAVVSVPATVLAAVAAAEARPPLGRLSAAHALP